MATVPDAVRSPGDDDAPGDLERLHTNPSELGEVSVDADGDGKPTITVPISSTTPHRSDGKVMAEEALQSMAQQLASREVGLWDDHGLSTVTGWRDYRREEMYGVWVAGEVDSDGVLWGTAELMEGRDATTSLIEQLDQDMPVGFSVGYQPLDEEMVAVDEGDDGEKRRQIFDVDLWETSPVGIPDNEEAIAAAGAVAAELDRADVDLTPEVASAVGTSVREALSSMSTNPDDDSTDSADGTEAAAGTETEDESDGDESAGTEPPEARFSDDEVEEIMEIFTAAMEDAMANVSEALQSAGDDSESDGGDGDGDEGGDDDDDDGESNSADGGESANADVADLAERLDTIEERNKELEERLEEKEAKIERLESETRESAGRKGISPAAGTGTGTETNDPDDPDDSGASTSDRNALTEAQRLGGGK